VRCYICDRDDDLITFDKITQSYSPCTVCQEVINECLETFEEEELDALSADWEHLYIPELRSEFAAEVQPTVPPDATPAHLVTSVLPRT
jgi:hypothetical protein